MAENETGDIGLEEYLYDPKAFCVVEWPAAAKAYLPPDRLEVPTLQEKREKSLGKILGFLWIVALPPNESIKWSPIAAAKIFERLLRCGR